MYNKVAPAVFVVESKRLSGAQFGPTELVGLQLFQSKPREQPIPKIHVEILRKH